MAKPPFPPKKDSKKGFVPFGKGEAPAKDEKGKEKKKKGKFPAFMRK